jgi:putative ABC transport system permease protein
MLDDVRSAFRQIRSNPAFTLAVVLTLALGIGATTAVFTLADPMLFRPLPFPDSERVVRVRVTGSRGQPLGTMPLADYLRAEERHSGFDAMCTFNIHSVGRLEGFHGEISLGGSDGFVSIYGFTEDCFDTFGMRPARGRAFVADDYPAGGQSPTVAIATYAFWRTALGARQGVIGETLRLTGPRLQSYVIVGVMPPQFFVPQTINSPPGLMVPVRPNAARAAEPRVADVIARLAPGVSIAAAAAEMGRIVREVEREFPSFPQERSAEVTRLQESLFGAVRTPLLMLLGATACVLLLACANLAHLFMARLHARDRELGVRLALGAGAWRVARQLMIEASLLAAFGGIAAIVFARWAFDFIAGWIPDFVPVYRLLPAAIDARVFAFAALLIALSAVVYGWLPALLATRADVRTRLQTSGRMTSTTGRTDRLLVFGQAAVAVSLLVTGALIVQSFVRLAYQPLGFQPYGLLQARVEPSLELQKDPARAVAVQRHLYEQLRARLPVKVALAGGMPGLTAVNRADRPDAQQKFGRVMSFPVSSTFFEVFELRLTRGRLFDETETFANPAVAVIDDRAASTLWPGEDPIGKILLDSTGRDTTMRTVIGTVATIRLQLTGQRPEIAGTAFTPIGPATRTLASYIRPTRQGPSVEEIRKIASEFLPTETVLASRVMMHERALGQPRFLAVLLGALSLVTIALTIVGVFGVVNHNVARRTREVGVRVALGASVSRVYRLLIGRPVVSATAGVIAGLAASWWWTRTLTTLLFGVQPHDMTTYALTATGVIALVASAAVLPTWRASRIDPTIALRVE